MAEPLRVATITIAVDLTDDDEIVNVTTEDDIGYSQGLGWIYTALTTWQETRGLRINLEDD